MPWRRHPAASHPRPRCLARRPHWRASTATASRSPATAPSSAEPLPEDAAEPEPARGRPRAVAAWPLTRACLRRGEEHRRQVDPRSRQDWTTTLRGAAEGVEASGLCAQWGLLHCAPFMGTRTPVVVKPPGPAPGSTVIQKVLHINHLLACITDTYSDIDCTTTYQPRVSNVSLQARRPCAPGQPDAKIRNGTERGRSGPVCALEPGGRLFTATMPELMSPLRCVRWRGVASGQPHANIGNDTERGAEPSRPVDTCLRATFTGGVIAGEPKARSGEKRKLIHVQPYVLLPQTNPDPHGALLANSRQPCKHLPMANTNHHRHAPCSAAGAGGGAFHRRGGVDLHRHLHTYYDTGMRKTELRLLRRSRLDLGRNVILLRAEDTKTGRARVVPLTDRVVEAIRSLPSLLGSEYVFVNPETGKPWNDPYKLFKRVCRSLGIEGVWLHDTRRSFSTNARRWGSSESEVMKVTGHTTRSTFDRYNIVDEEDARTVIRRLQAGTATELARTGQELRQDSVKIHRSAVRQEKGPTAKCP